MRNNLYQIENSKNKLETFEFYINKHKNEKEKYKLL